ncbi:MAG: NAD(P)/FAD-dependent oxidoreductase [Verrucomicrobia bacterium]|nr:NAD(P)/FAD-dependent oxidoreductase [Verrucomicrobiota bacterium]
MKDYDFAVIGGGSAGYSAASTAASLGLSTAVIESGAELGGLCILRGCMPNKTFIESANRFLTLRRAPEYGLSAQSIAFDPKFILNRKRRLVGDFARHRVEQLMDGRFELIRGRASFLTPHRLQVTESAGETREFEFKTSLVSTGSTVNVLEIPGLLETGFLDSDRALESATVPPSVIILGGGAIALEFAHYYEALGSRVTIVQRSSRLLKELDPDVTQAIADAYRARGIEVICGTRLVRIGRSGADKTVTYIKNDEERTIAAAEIFYALGRRPQTEALNLAAAGVKTNQSGAIVVNAALQSSQPNIFGAGDVTGLYDVVHVAVEQGAVAARNAVQHLRAGELATLDYRLKLVAVFSHPELAAIGLTEAEARQRGIRFRCAKYPFDDHGKSIVRGETEGFVKLLADANTNEIIGAAVVGPEASELIHEISVAMYFHATAKDLAQVPHYHPTLSEIWTYPAEDLAS